MANAHCGKQGRGFGLASAAVGRVPPGCGQCAAGLLMLQMSGEGGGMHLRACVNVWRGKQEAICGSNATIRSGKLCTSTSLRRYRHLSFEAFWNSWLVIVVDVHRGPGGAPFWVAEVSSI